MKIPKVPPTLWTERAGVISVAAEVNRLGLIWREQPSVDVGIDGQIELVGEHGEATGRVVAVQIKSGESYLRGTEDHWVFHPDVKHRFYWERFPVPVLLMLHSPDRKETYWVDARQALRGARRDAPQPIFVPRGNLLQHATAEDLFYTTGGVANTLLDVSELLVLLCSTRSTSLSFAISYFELFANGLTNIANSIYYGMDLVMEILEANVGDGWITIGHNEHEFLFGFLRLLFEQDLAEVDISHCLVDWHEREKQPTTIAPLTSRGRQLVARIHEQQVKFERDQRLRVPPYHGVAQEDFVRMAFTPGHYERLPLIKQFEELVLEDNPGVQTSQDGEGRSEV